MKLKLLIAILIIFNSCSSDGNNSTGLVPIDFMSNEIIEESNGIITIESISAEKVNTSDFRVYLEFFAVSAPLELNVKSYKVEVGFSLDNGSNIYVESENGDIFNQQRISTTLNLFKVRIKENIVDLKTVKITVINTDNSETKYILTAI